MLRTRSSFVRIFISLSALVSAVLAIASTNADTIHWNVNNGDMSVPGNWSPATVPTSGDIGVIGSGGPIVARMFSALAGPPDELQVLADGTLEINATIAADQNIVMMGGLLRNSANRNYSGDVFLDSDSTFGASSSNLGLSGLIQDNGGNAGKFIKVNNGSVSLTSTNTYSGGTEIQGGILTVTANNATGTGDILITSAGTLNHQSATLDGRIISDGGTISTVANYNLNATIGLENDTTFSTTAAASTLSGVIEDEGGTPGKFIKTGSGTYTLSNNSNTFSAGLELQQGGITGSTTGSLGSGGVDAQSGTTITLRATTTQGAGVILQGGALAVLHDSGDAITALDGSSFRLFQDNRSTQNPVNITGTVTMLTPPQVSQTTQNFQGVISGSGKLVYDGSADAAQLTDLEAVNTYLGGTDIEAGILRIASAGRLPDVGTVTIKNGATLNYTVASDTIGGLAGNGLLELGGASLTVAEGISPGLSAGELTIGETGTVTLGASSNSLFELGSLSGPNDIVTFADGANLVLDGTLTIASLGGIEVGDYTLFDLNGGTTVGAFDNVNFLGSISGFVSINAGNDVILSITSVIPEPGSFMLMCLALVPMVLRTRQRRQS